MNLYDKIEQRNKIKKEFDFINNTILAKTKAIELEAQAKVDVIMQEHSADSEKLIELEFMLKSLEDEIKVDVTEQYNLTKKKHYKNVAVRLMKDIEYDEEEAINYAYNFNKSIINIKKSDLKKINAETPLDFIKPKTNIVVAFYSELEENNDLGGM